MANPRQPAAIEIKPANGGRLMAGLSAEAAGIANYIVKRDWRRYLDREIRAEGHEGFVLNQAVPANIQITPGGFPLGGQPQGLRVIANARRGDGKCVIVAGNQTTLWAYTGTEDTNYVSNNGVDDYFASGSYVDNTQYGWIQIASGLSSNGRRWEAVQVGDYLCFNNGVDLPLTFRPGDIQAYPIYELREQQIASVGTIAVHNGNLLCMDLWIINDTDFLSLMAPLSVTDDYNFIPNSAQYAAFTDTTKMQRFPQRILPSYPGQPRRFGATVPVGANYADWKLTFLYPVRSLPELVMLNQAAGNVGSKLVGGATDITVLYAGIGGATLNTSVIGIKDGIAMSCLVSDMVQNPIIATGNLTSSIEATDAVNSYAGTYIDLIDDGGAIIKALALRDQIVVYKDTPFIYLGSFTGDSASPYQFTRVPIANEAQALSYRNSIIASGGGFYGSCHIYAGRNAFYKWDGFSQTPQEIPELQAVQDLFFNNAVHDKENAWVAENPLTREWCFGWQQRDVASKQRDVASNCSGDRALCVDYAHKTVRTTSAPMVCAARVQHPTRDDWLFLFGADDGSVQRYGLLDAPIEVSNTTVTIQGNKAVTALPFFTADHAGKTLMLGSGDTVAIAAFVSPTTVTIIGGAPNANGATSFKVLPAIWHRNGQPYDSILETGAGDFGSADSEKMVLRYVAVASSQSNNAKLDLNFKAGLNPGSMTFVQSASILAPQAGHNLVQPTFIGYYVGGQIKICGLNNPFELVSQIWRILPIGSQSAGRL